MSKKRTRVLSRECKFQVINFENKNVVPLEKNRKWFQQLTQKFIKLKLRFQEQINSGNIRKYYRGKALRSFGAFGRKPILVKCWKLAANRCQIHIANCIVGRYVNIFELHWLILTNIGVTLGQYWPILPCYLGNRRNYSRSFVFFRHPVFDAGNSLILEKKHFSCSSQALIRSVGGGVEGAKLLHGHYMLIASVYPIQLTTISQEGIVWWY